MRALVVCPGRGSYNRSSLGYLAGRAPKLLDLVDGYRSQRGRPTVTELDQAESFRGRLHMAGENASLLTFTCSLADRLDLSSDFEVVGVMGNSMGWYTALAVAGALEVPDAVRLVESMATYQQGNVLGAQLMVPVAHPDWTPDPERRARLNDVLRRIRAEGHGAWWSIDLGTFAVVGADDAGAKLLTEWLEPETRGERTFPMRLPMHSAFHTPLLEATSERAFGDLGDLDFEAPRLPLVDGLGRVHWPRTADPAILLGYTLGAQVVDTYDFATSLATSLAITAPDVVVLLGPGNSLGGPVAAGLVRSGWRGMRTRADFESMQESSEPALLSFGVEEQRARLT